MRPSIFPKEYGRIDCKGQTDIGACETQGPETGDRTGGSPRVGCCQVPIALEFGGLFDGGYAVGVRKRNLRSGSDVLENT